MNRRADRRRQQKRDDPHNPRESSLERERDKVREGLQDLTTKTFAWEVGRPSHHCHMPLSLTCIYASCRSTRWPSVLHRSQERCFCLSVTWTKIMHIR